MLKTRRHDVHLYIVGYNHFPGFPGLQWALPDTYLIADSTPTMPNDLAMHLQDSVQSIAVMNDTVTQTRGAWEETRGGPISVAVVDTGMNM